MLFMRTGDGRSDDFDIGHLVGKNRHEREPLCPWPDLLFACPHAVDWVSGPRVQRIGGNKRLWIVFNELCQTRQALIAKQGQAHDLSVDQNLFSI